MGYSPRDHKELDTTELLSTPTLLPSVTNKIPQYCLKLMVHLLTSVIVEICRKFYYVTLSFIAHSGSSLKDDNGKSCARYAVTTPFL